MMLTRDQARLFSEAYKGAELLKAKRTIQSLTPSSSWGHLDAALEGGAGDVSEFLRHIPKEEHANLAVNLFDHAPPWAYRRIFQVIHRDTMHKKLIKAGGIRKFEAMVRAAGTPVHKLPDKVTVWRGTAGISIDAAKTGIYWTIEKETASAYAMWRSKAGFGEPLVITATVPRGKIAAHFGGWLYPPRGFDFGWNEVLIFGGIKDAEVCGDIAEWTAELDRLEEDVGRREKEMDRELEDARADCEKAEREIQEFLESLA